MAPVLAGAIARIVVPGRQAIGCLTTLVVGIVGAFLGGLIGQVLFGHRVRFGWHLRPFLLAVAGAVLLLLLLQAIAGRRRHGPL
ncbi:MAG TPA: GlsB/YeaQ/YmgE family stress response membrane protein [Gaiellaceae bacterium]